MTEIDITTCKRLASLCKIATSEEEMQELTIHLQTIVNYVEQLKEVDTKGVTATVSPYPLEIEEQEDIEEEIFTKKAYLQNIEHALASMIKVPTVLEGE